MTAQRIPLGFLITLTWLVGSSGSLDAQTVCEDGLAAQYPCQNVSLLSRLSLDQLGGSEGANDNWGWQDPETGKYYALTGLHDSTSFVDVTDPVNPVILGRMLSDVGSGVARDIKTYAGHAFVVADISGHGMQVFDLTRLRNVTQAQTFEPDTVYRDISGAHNLAINEDSGYAYLVSAGEDGNCPHGMQIVDITNPRNPVQEACYDATGRIHDIQCVIYSGPDQAHKGSEICFASNNPNLTILDVSDKGDIRLLGQETWPAQAFAHQGWLSEDQGYFLLGDEADEGRFNLPTRTIVIDVHDLDSPDYVGTHQAETTAIDHNMYVKGNLLYQANYAAGLRILRMDDLATAALTEVAYFDTQPFRDNGLGAWNVYPFFDNCTLLVNDMTAGLFVLGDELCSRFEINPGLNDAWFNADNAGQGFFIIVFEDTGIIFMAWFTYDTELPPDDVVALLGAAEHRWLTAQGPYDGDTATLNVFLTEGGIFDMSEPAPTTGESIGTITIVWTDCENGVLTYDIDPPGVSGETAITRIVPDNVALCEALAGE